MITLLTGALNLDSTTRPSHGRACFEGDLDIGHLVRDIEVNSARSSKLFAPGFRAFAIVEIVITEGSRRSGAPSHIGCRESFAEGK